MDNHDEYFKVTKILTDDILKENSKYLAYFKMKKNKKWILFDENYKLNELKSTEKVFDFKNVCVLIYAKIEEEN